VEVERREEAAMHRSRRLLSSALTFASLALPHAVPAADLSPTAVTFAPGYEAAFSKTYGTREVSALRLQIVDLVSHSLRSAGSRCSLTLSVTLERAAPTHPTMQQQLDNPALDPFRTVFRDGGASLTGRVLDSGGHVIATVQYADFNGDMRPISPAKDPWGDARFAIQAFSSRVVDACIKMSSDHS
jgi:hypothetical protein